MLRKKKLGIHRQFPYGNFIESWHIWQADIMWPAKSVNRCGLYIYIYIPYTYVFNCPTQLIL